jgi:hypothetical protein
MQYSPSRRRGEYTFLKADKPDSNLFQSQWLFYFMKMFYYYLLTISSSFWAFVYDSVEQQMLIAISLVIEQRKNEFDRIEKVWVFSPSIFMPYDGDITFRTLAKTS